MEVSTATTACCSSTCDFFSARALPNDQIFADSLEFNEVYQRLLNLESTRGKDLVSIRWLGYLLREVPVKGSLATEILACTNDAEILELSKIYMGCLLRLCEQLVHCV